MKTPAPSDIRNFAVVGHASSGKTMLCEAMLRCANIIPRMGKIQEGSTVSDYHTSEKTRQISVSSSLLHATWNNRLLNILDNPGYLDFMSEGLGTLRVGDFALIVVNGVDGLGVGTDRAWEYATRFGLPKMLVINQLDRATAHFDDLLEELRVHFGRHVFPLAVPIQTGPGFSQVLDVLRSEVVSYRNDSSGTYTEEPAAGEWATKVKELHRELIEHIAESDDALMTRYFEKGNLSEEEFRAGIHAAVQKELFIPVFATAAESNIGVARLMDFIAKYGSSPVDRRAVEAIDSAGQPASVQLEGTEPVVYIFKTMSEEHFGELSFFRVYSGHITTGMDLLNTDRNITERIGPLYRLNGHNRILVPELGPGDIGAVVKLKDTHTGNTLCHPRHALTLPKVQYPRPNIHAALKLDTKGEEDKVATGLASLHEEDPTFLHRVDSELHQTILSAQGELHLELIIDRLRRRHHVHVHTEEPRIPYRETIRIPADSKHRHKKQTGGAGQFAEVWMKIAPLPRNSGFQFTESLTGQNVDRSFVPSVEKGVQTACTDGILAGCRVTDVQVDFYDGKMHPVDSKDIAFQIAGYFAFREAFLKANPILLEPIYTIEARIPEDSMGRVMGDLSGRRGRILGIEIDGAFQVVKATVPARELYRYSSTLRSLTGGRGVHTEAFSHYEEMPRDLEAKVVEEYKAKRQHTPDHAHGPAE